MTVALGDDGFRVIEVVNRQRLSVTLRGRFRLGSREGFMTKIITLYNHKGGVSKTTTTYHLAYALAEAMKLKVLVVDADPACGVLLENQRGEFGFEIVSSRTGEATAVGIPFDPLL